MSKDEALRMALDALENLFGTPPAKFGGDVAVWRIGGSSRSQQAIDAIKKVLAQPEREWVGLTDEEMKKTWYEMRNIMGWYSFQEISKAIEAKLKDKNT